jgi:hypothetical protein
MKRIALVLSVALGAMDALTGLMLIFAPALVLRLLGVAPLAAEARVLLSWIGVFVASVGFSYAFALRGGVAAETVWRCTALVRMAVACFLAARIFSGDLALAWALVAASDASVATLQLIGLKARWWQARG